MRQGLFELAFYHVDKLLLRMYVNLGTDMLDMAFHGVARNGAMFHDEVPVKALSEHCENLTLARYWIILLFCSFAALVD